MVTRAERLADFIADADPPLGSVVEVLCEDHVGTYRLPWLCRSRPEGLHPGGLPPSIPNAVCSRRRSSDRTRADSPDRYGGVNVEPLVKAAQSAGGLGLVEQRQNLAKSRVIQIVGSSVLIDKFGNMGLHRPTRGFGPRPFQACHSFSPASHGIGKGAEKGEDGCGQQERKLTCWGDHLALRPLRSKSASGGGFVSAPLPWNRCQDGP
jgi:hypothetical protein